ncbi:MAG: hypothetical protein ACE5GK_08490, partial [Nitrospiria bacterium]
GSRPSGGKGAFLTTYGGFAFSSADIEGVGGGKEDNPFGFFAGLLVTINENATAGIELRLVDQTAVSLSAIVPF